MPEETSVLDPTDDSLDPAPVVAKALGVSTQTLANWRSTRRHDLGEVRLGRMVRYRRSKWRAVLAAGLR